MISNNPKVFSWKRVHTTAVISLNLAILFLVSSPRLMAWSTTVVWIIGMILMTTLVLVIGHGFKGRLDGVLIDERNKLSLSRLQLGFWAVLVTAALLAIAAHNLNQGAKTLDESLDFSVPQDILWAMGLSTASLVASPVIKAYKGFQSPAKSPEPEDSSTISNSPGKGLITTNERSSDASLADFFRGEEVGNANTIDLSKLQMLIMTVMLVAIYGLQLAHLFGESRSGLIPALPSLGDGMVAFMGLSHAGYLTHKAAPLSQRAI